LSSPRGAAAALLTALLTALLLAAGSALAQIPDDLLDRRPNVLAQDVFNSPYGKLLAAEFVAVLRGSADPACLADKGLRPEQLEARGRDLLVRSGALMLQFAAALVNGAKLEAEFDRRAGKSARAEIVRLRADRDVRDYLKLSEPAKLSRLANNIVEMVDRHALIARLGLKRPVSPIATGSVPLLRADPEEKSLADADRFVKERQSASLNRFLEIQVALAESFREATDTQALLKAGPAQMTPNVPGDLAKLCVLPK
jgi:hypothetical protein